MTKSIFTGLLLLLFCPVLIGQSKSTFTPELSIGVNAGATFSKINFITTHREPAPLQNMLQQYVGGISARYISEKNFGLQVEMNYSQRGWDEYLEGYPNSYYTQSLGYLEIPLLTHIYFNAGKKGRIIFDLGPQLGFLLNDKKTTNYSAIPDTSYLNLPIQKKFDWGISIGTGFEFHSGIGNFILEGRYYYGLSDIFNNSKTDYFATSSNQVINVKLTYLYEIRRKK